MSQYPPPSMQAPPRPPVYGPFLPERPQPLVYIVQGRERLADIAQRYFVNVNDLVKANLHLCDPYDLRGGEALIMPLDKMNLSGLNSYLLRHTFNDTEPRQRFGQLKRKNEVDPQLFLRCSPDSKPVGALTVAQLAQIAPNLKRSKAGSAEAVTDAINFAITLAEINTPERLAGFLSQVVEESDGLNTAQEYASGAQYDKRVDLGNVPANKEGARFKGRGFIQLTGRKNYTNCWLDLGFPVTQDATTASYYKGVDPIDPERAARNLEDAARVTAWFWRVNNINALCDTLSASKDERAVLYQISQTVNNPSGTPNGWATRQQYYRAAKHVLGYTWGTMK